MSDTSPCIGVFGGSFDPPHVAHGLVAAWALASGSVDEVLVIPAFRHAFGKESASFEARVAMCELAFAAFERVRISTVEQDLGQSRTLHTLEALEERMPQARFRLLIGADILPETDRWHRWDAIVERAPPLIIGREGYEGGESLHLPNVSSTEIRRRLAEDMALEGWLHPDVASYARENELYEAAR